MDISIFLKDAEEILHPRYRSCRAALKAGPLRTACSRMVLAFGELDTENRAFRVS
jgi:hypothetical protein